MTSLQGLSSAPLAARGLVSGVAVPPAPGSLTAPLYVVVAALGGMRFKCSWMPRDALMPVSGSQCLLAFDEQNRAWCVCWQ